MFSRRSFLKAGAAGIAAPWIVPASVLGADGSLPPSERINVANIGIGAMGSGHLQHVLANFKTVRLVAVCDVDAVRRDNAKAIAEARYAQSLGKGAYSGIAEYNDFREVLARKDVDAVLIATPDHWHTPLTIAAAKAHKDVYCEKPVSHCLAEGRDLVNAVQENKIVFQNGSQYRSMRTMRPVIDFIRAGGLGKVTDVFALWMKGIYVPGKQGRFCTPQPDILPTEPVPQGLDWNLWVGPAPMRGFNKAYHRNPIPGVVPWNFCSDFGTGVPTFYHSHEAEMIQYAIGCETTGPVEIIHPAQNRFPTLTSRYANGALFHVINSWEEARKQYPVIPAGFQTEGRQVMFGGLFVGEKGWIAAFYGSPVQGAEKILKAAGIKPGAPFIASNDHHENWFACIKSRAKPYSSEELGHRSAAAGHLVNICFNLGRTLKWDPVKEEFIGDDAANKLRAKTYRAY